MSPKSSTDNDGIYTGIMNPKAQQKLEWDILPLVERPVTLEKKTLYIINQRWGGTKAHEPLLLEMKKWFESNIRGINVVYKVKRGSYHTEDPDLWREVGKKADAAVIGVPA
ncbi:MAG: hypothetical protein GX631_08015 [Dehalococcoidales bacterium]|jgi:hypothetical protein|nr:hypothetical protein [Dehalococcoidales bacterium]